VAFGLYSPVDPSSESITLANNDAAATANSPKALTSLAVAEQDIFAPFGRSIAPALRLY